ncbi:MAG: hypothetical protein IT581_21835 [Verrucomicrobiales bacterium]|nr:hypothetical protein [Verrucomicrobiales bacterium]
MKRTALRVLAVGVAVLIAGVAGFDCANRRPTSPSQTALDLIALHRAQPTTQPFQSLVLSGTNIPLILHRRGFNSLILTPFAISADLGGGFFGVRIGQTLHVRMTGDTTWSVTREYSLGPWSRRYTIGTITNAPSKGAP